MIFKKIINRIIDYHPSAISFKESMDLTGLPIITFCQIDEKGNENRFNFLLDTGSNDNVIDSNVLKDIEHEKVDYNGTLSGLDGIVNKVTACNISFFYKDREYPYFYLVKDMSAPFKTMKSDYGVTLHGILGSRFFNKFRYVLDFADLKVYNKE